MANKVVRMTPEAAEDLFAYFKLTPESFAAKLSELCGEQVTPRMMTWTGECRLYEGEEEVDYLIDHLGNITLKEKNNGAR